jgi:hypothetical protein
MLTKLLPDQVSKFWDVIKYAVENSLPPTVVDRPDKMNRILSSMLCGNTEVWVSYKQGTYKFEAILVTKFIYDDDSGTKNLLIYSLFSYEHMDESSWIEGKDALIEYAKNTGCSLIIAYSANPQISKMAKMLGADTSFTLISYPVNKSVL